MSENTSDLKRSSSTSRILFAPSLREGKAARLLEPVKKEVSEAESTQPTLASVPKAISSSQLALGRYRSQSAHGQPVQKSGEGEDPKKGSESPSKPREATRPPPISTCLKTEPVLAKLGENSGTVSPSRLRETTKYDSYRFRNG